MVDMSSNQTKSNQTYLIYMYKEDLALNNQQWLICHKTKPNTKDNYSWIIIKDQRDQSANKF